MPSPQRLVHFLWHMHQPYYSTPDQPRSSMPWVRLHATKAYYDMARMLEKFPEVRCTMNFSGCLLLQIHEYVHLEKRDTWWDLTRKPAADLSQDDKQVLIANFFSTNWETCIRPLPRYWELLEKRGHNPKTLDPNVFTTQDWLDLQVLFNIAWFGFSAREEFQQLQALIAQGRNFVEADKQTVLDLQMHIMGKLLPMYRKLHESGQIEISLTPMYHPILPLVIDTEVAQRATPDRPRPPRFAEPDDANYQVAAALQAGRDLLGIEVQGMWPAEGSVSPEAVNVFANHKLRWIATDEDVLARSLGKDWSRNRDLYRAWRLRAAQQPVIFFRDHGLSDQLGFVYSKNEPHDAVNDLLSRIESSAQQDNAAPDAPTPLFNIILDGENPWEHYPNDGQAFLTLLYERLTQSTTVRTTTPSQYLAENPPIGTLEHLHSGSWILGNYQIWIGHSETNRAWELLGRTRRRLKELSQSGDVEPQALQSAWQALYIAQGSDWFWWYGDDFSSEQDDYFDLLFRSQLMTVYQALGESVPRDLQFPINSQAAHEVAFTPPQDLISPSIDGKNSYFYEWKGAGFYKNTGAHGAMFENTRVVNAIYVGFDLENLYVRIEPGPDFRTDSLADSIIRVTCQLPNSAPTIDINPADGARGMLKNADNLTELIHIAFEEFLEFAIPFAVLDATPNQPLSLNFLIINNGIELERHPAQGNLELLVPDSSFNQKNWIV